LQQSTPDPFHSDPPEYDEYRTDMDKVNGAIFEGEKAASLKLPKILKIVDRRKQ
jgi:hypothetical protein